MSRMSRDSPATSPSRGISHSAWLRRTFSGDSGHGLGAENVWPDLLVDRRSLAERRQAPTQGWNTFAIERNNIVGLRYYFQFFLFLFSLLTNLLIPIYLMMCDFC